MRNPAPFPAAQSWMIENPVTRLLARRFVHRLDVRPGMRVLDYGCGPGRLTVPLARSVGVDGEVVALDLQPEMLARVERRAAAAGLSNVRTLQAAAGEAVLPPGRFDLAVLAYVLGEIPPGRRGAAMAEIAAALRPGGHLVVVEGGFDPHRQTPEAVRALAEPAGLRVEEVRRGWLTIVITLRSGA
ncbi:MAG TPA: methyltransferase domain-containing protein [Candidatus Dormibacteraeota bacterium]|nr:methyltransferase domain-containing protein [Candidatus Dormibacteraeota bacterium]